MESLDSSFSLHLDCKCDDFLRCTVTQIRSCIVATCYTLPLVLVVDNTDVQGRAGKCAALESHRK